MTERLQKDRYARQYLDRPWLKFYTDGLAPDLEIPFATLDRAFDEAAARWKSHVALDFYGGEVTYGELKDQVDRFATALARLGVARGDRVALYMLNCPQFVISFYAALKVGAGLTPISPVYVTSEIGRQLEDSGARTIICQDILFDTIRRAGAGWDRIIVARVDEYLPRWKRVFGTTILRTVYKKMEIPRIGIDKGPGIHEFRDLVRNSSPAPPETGACSPDDLAVLPYTGGTTGSPKGVMLTHRNLLAAAALSNAFWSRSPGRGEGLTDGCEVMAAYMPFYHISGQMSCVVMGILHGYKLVLFTNPDPDDILNGIGGGGITFFIGVPSLYEFLNNYEKTDRADWKRLKLVISGADALLEDTARNWERRVGTEILEGYGMSETSAITHMNPAGRRKVGSFGIPLPNTGAAVIDPGTGAFAAPGEVGELIVNGPQVMRGYWERPEETDRAFMTREGEKWLRTGDLARMDEEGYFSFYDRIKDLIKYKGLSIFAREVEEVLKSHPRIQEAAVIGVPDPAVGEHVKAFVVLEADARGRVSEEDIIAYCEGRLAHYKIPRWIEFRREIPKTDVGKVSRRELRIYEDARPPGSLRGMAVIPLRGSASEAKRRGGSPNSPLEVSPKAPAIRDRGCASVPGPSPGEFVRELVRRDTRMPRLLEVERLTKSFGGLAAVRGVSFSMERREMVGLIGPNGSGKTTLIRLIIGMLKADGGTVRFNGEDITGRAPWRVVRRGIAMTHQAVRPSATCLSSRTRSSAAWAPEGSGGNGSSGSRARPWTPWSSAGSRASPGSGRLPPPVRAAVVSAWIRLDRRFNLVPPPPLDPGTRARLTAGYREDILKLQDLIGRDLARWMV